MTSRRATPTATFGRMRLPAPKAPLPAPNERGWLALVRWDGMSYCASGYVAAALTSAKFLPIVRAHDAGGSSRVTKIAKLVIGNVEPERGGCHAFAARLQGLRTRERQGESMRARDEQVAFGPAESRRRLAELRPLRDDVR